MKQETLGEVSCFYVYDYDDRDRKTEIYLIVGCE